MKNKSILASVGALALAATIQSAAAADLPPRPPVYKAPPPVELFSWTGFYIGAHGGYGWGEKESTTLPITDPNLGLVTTPVTNNHLSGGLAGGQIGFNYQVSNIVWGVEAQASWADINGTVPCTVVSANFGLLTTSCTGSAKIDSLGTVAGRLGVAYDRTLFYVKGGGAWTHDKYGSVLVSAFLPPTASASENRWGWMTGVGIEYAFTGNWSAKVEYNYMDMGTKRVTFTTSTGATNGVDIRERVNVVKFGINYRFGGPVVARY